MTSVTEAVQAGDLITLQSILNENVDVNTKDESGNSLLVIAAKAGHEQIVRELLARGADRHEALAQGLGQDGSVVASLLNEQSPQHEHGQEQPNVSYANGSHVEGSTGPNGGEGMYAPVPTDIYGGYQLPDGSIAYGGYPAYPPPFQGAPGGPPSFYHDPVMFPHPNAMAYGFPPGHQNGHQSRASGSFPPTSHVRKPSAVGKYPPPEVAKTIPCRFYPNCRNGSSCIFAHIDMPQTSEAQGGQGEPSSAASPSAYPPHAYFAPPGPYGAGPPQYFPVHAMHYSGPHGPMPLHYQPHEASQPGQMTPAPPSSASQAHASPVPAPTPAAQDASAPATGDVAQSPSEPAQPSTEKETATDSSSTSQQPSGTSISPSVASAPVFQPASQQSVPQVSGAVVDGKTAVDRRRRQSFNSFLHSHAIPFQPSEMSSVPLGPAAAMNGHGHGHGHSFGLGGRGKLRGRGAHSGMLGRGSRERGPCSFFAKNACKYGSECLFPHVLPDGTDARRQPNVNAHSAAAAGTAGPSSSPTADSKPAANGANDSSVENVAKDVATTIDSGNGESRPHAAQSSADSAQETAQESFDASAQAGQQDQQANGVVPSKPSATLLAEGAVSASVEPPTNGSTPTAASAARQPQAQSSSTTSSSQPQPQQHQPPQHPRNTSQPSRKQQGGRNNSSAQNGPAAKKTPVQRVPNVADFPALPGSPSGAASLTSSPALGSASPSINRTTTSVAAAESAQSNTAAPAKVNFSAILSAPAPVKKAAEEATTPPAIPTEESDAPSQDKDEKAATTTSEEEVKTGEETPATAATNGPPASVWGKPLSNGVASSAANRSPVVVNGHGTSVNVTKEKPATPTANGAKGSRSSKANGNKDKSWASQKQASAPSSKEPEVDADDFQLVKSRNHSKKNHQSTAGRVSGVSNGSGSNAGLGNASKAAVAA
ncbi:unnamed protein product [Sympodiomycopsis kandeliae]